MGSQSVPVSSRDRATAQQLRSSLPGATPDMLFAHALEHGYAGRLGRMIRERAMREAPGTPLFLNFHPQEL